MKYITVDIESDVPETVNALEKQWKKLFPDSPFEYFFLDDYFNKQYASEQRLEKVFTTFSGLSIFIACLGIFGYSYFVIHQRIKEIGIRKVLGATSFGLIKLLTGEFIILILIAGVLSIPLTYYLANFWLAEFAYRIDLQVLYFIVPTIIVTIMAFFTIQLHLVKAIRKNPVDSLKYE
jgi:putative ABC transport system permease protein